VFLTYFPKYREFENKFIIVPAPELDKLVNRKKVDKRDRYFFCFNFEGNRVTDKRDSCPVDHSDYLNRWDLIQQALEK